MLQRVREDILLMKLRAMLQQETRKHEREQDTELIETIRRVIRDLEAQWEARPRPNNKKTPA